MIWSTEARRGTMARGLGGNPSTVEASTAVLCRYDTESLGESAGAGFFKSKQNTHTGIQWNEPGE